MTDLAEPSSFSYLVQGEGPRFANPSERFCAEVFEAFHVPWAFQPRTFVLDSEPEGRVTSAFTPDFYLPTQDLYVEVTAMKQSLVFRKRRKVRRVQEVFPGMRCELFSRRDIPLLADLLPPALGLRAELRPRVEVLSTLVDPTGRPTKIGSAKAYTLAQNSLGVVGALGSYLSWQPEQLFKLKPTQFEELVAELLIRGGYTVELTAPSADGGIDIFASCDEEGGPILYGVQCKRAGDPRRRIGVGVVRELYGAISYAGATAGVLVTTSSFTRDARLFERAFANRISLKDFEVIQRWLRRRSASM
jgi:hypothetical protein